MKCVQIFYSRLLNQLTYIRSVVWPRPDTNNSTVRRRKHDSAWSFRFEEKKSIQKWIQFNSHDNLFGFVTLDSYDLWKISQSFEIDFLQLYQRLQLFGKNSHIFANCILSSCCQHRQFNQIALRYWLVVYVARFQWHSAHFEYFGNGDFHASFAKHIATIHILKIDAAPHFGEKFYNRRGASNVQTRTNDSRTCSISQFRLPDVSQLVRCIDVLCFANAQQQWILQ